MLIGLLYVSVMVEPPRPLDIIWSGSPRKNGKEFVLDTTTLMVLSDFKTLFMMPH